MEPFLKLGSRKDGLLFINTIGLNLHSTGRVGLVEHISVNPACLLYYLTDFELQISKPTFISLIIFLNVTQQPGMTLISLIQTHVKVLLQDAAQTHECNGPLALL